MSTIINGTSSAITFPDATVQNTSAVVSGKVPASLLPAGTVLQVAQQVYTTYTSTSSNSMVDSGLTVNITPSNSSNKVLVTVSMTIASSSAGYDIAANIVRNGTTVGIGTASSNTNSTAATVISTPNHPNSLSFCYLDSPSTTSAVTYKIQWRIQSGATAYMNATTYVSGGSDTYQSGYISTITVQEISGS